MKKYLYIIFILFLFIGFIQCKNENKIITSGNHTTNTSKQLLERLHQYKRNNKILIGHQDALAYGVQWKYVEGNSDFNLVTGRYPSVYGWDLAGIELNNVVNIDSVPFGKIRHYMLLVHKNGGINTCSWHTYNPVTGGSSWDNTENPNLAVSHIIPGGLHHKTYTQYLDKVADFFLSLKTPDGTLVPVIFRPFHENNGNWFWWGQIHCTPDEYIQLFRFTADYLRDTKKVTNLLFAYSPDIKFDTHEQFMSRYPGDKYVDILGIDDYYDFKKENPVEEAVKHITILADEAIKRNKLYAITETGDGNIPDYHWFTKELLTAIKHSEKTRGISYVLFWRNADSSQYFIPYPGHPASENFRNFVSDSVMHTLDKFSFQQNL